ncbi:MAG: formylglycine-generating enzyme family protein [Nitrospinota bacterium]|nr:formylglycine-generating enzyme family protein [Nitrospinota bacterium]
MIRKVILITLVFSILNPTAGAPNPGKSENNRQNMAFIPSGEYLMGSIKSLKEHDPTAFLNPDRHMLGPDNKAHKVFVDDFYIDLYETRNADYATFINSKDVKAAGFKKPRFWDHPDFNDPLQPVVGVSWKEARAFCLWNNKRLPTEAEWEKASRGKRPIAFPWGDEAPDSKKLNYHSEIGKTVKVGSYEEGKSDYGVYDLSGNVSEWVFDWHDADFYQFSPKKNPKGPSKGKYKVIRGGNWRNISDDVRLAYRGATVPKIRNKTVGFRCAKDPPH